MVSALTHAFAKEMKGYTPARVEEAAEKSFKLKYFPKPREFAECLKMSFEDYGFPSPGAALRKLIDWRSKKGFGAKNEQKLEPVIYTTYMAMDVFQWARMQSKQSQEYFEAHYLAVIDGIANGQPLRDQKVAIAEESVVKPPSSPEKAAEARKNLRAAMGLK